ncbi:bifunctional o-acetylhomoserine/o-acetylserine sulfhydrylase [Streptomyces clavuligerus]|nr:bifunctional o-acetylhomoserine/o-acetylserine sulfhydrylase [Streptomyces clavuligerus]ANW16856.1 bifunctional o-acetylhomoserine/o-acetylserine sulfhydrylase [Streptomyces clavuligerus]AXU11385.1 bifunctional o-acetylhomoserine/o-acetylserine sulfhydrylase [Streptomyces clavuligerus]MBY6301198.1 bifunctional o-acetylhomoserine/o-acetylserine sulfhydrylase [Streptomyces clavuligerus]QCS04256.1 bifunctional o-acetylhomoserine/o-acetylserine sulfhydrylase [Streptomyces clavuligerus]QPJ96356.
MSQSVDEVSAGHTPDEPAADPRSGWSFETRQVHAGAAPDPATGARAVPVYQTTSFVFRDTQHAADLFSLAEPGHIYTRIHNPTSDVLEQRVAALEGGVAAVALASGQAAETLAILTLAGAGDHIVSSTSLYGGTYNLFRHTLPKFGIEVSFVDDPDDIDAWRAAIRPTTKALFAESLGNPRGNVLDVRAVADAAHAAGVPLIVDNTVPTPFLLRPVEHGADIVVHSATKFLGGHGTTIGGVVVDGGTFDFGAHPERFPDFSEPDPSYHGLRYWPVLGAGAFAVKLRVQLLRDLGPALSPHSAFLLLQGIETLSLRMERHSSNALALARWLSERDEVSAVHYPGLPGNRWHEAATRYLPDGAGAVLSFELRDGVEAGRRFVDGVELFSHLANIGDVRSLIIHPASTTHSQLAPDQLAATGTTPGLVRLSAGIENITDLVADLEAGFRAAKGAS